MAESRHFIIFQRTPNHCATWLLKADTLYDAFRKYALDQFAREGENGDLIVNTGSDDPIIFDHPLPCIEAIEKNQPYYRLGWSGWEIREIGQECWDAEMAEVFCSENPYDIREYISLCRPLLSESLPDSKARAFVWYLKDGPLVTFYRKRSSRWDWHPLQYLGRFLIPWAESSKPREWQGTYDDILDQMRIVFPF